MSRSRVWAVVLSAVGAALVFAAPASAAFKPYSIVICAPGETCTAPPSSGSAVGSAIVAPSAGSQVMTATLTNENKLGTGLRLGSANLTPPAGFSVNGASYPACSTCTVSVVGNVVELRNLSLIPGATVVLSMSVSTPASGYTVASAPTSPWTIVSKQSNDFSGPPGNDVNVDPKTSTLTTVLGVLQFDTQPADVALGAHITGTDYDPSGSPVTVGAVDLSAQPISWFAGAVAITINPTSGGLGGTTSATAGTGGVASFGDLTVGTSGYNYTLSASSPNVTGAGSGQFDAHDQGASVNCGSAKCSSSLTQSGTTSQTTQVNSSSTAGLLTVAVDNGVGYWTSQPVFTDCGNYTPLGPDTALIDLLDTNAAKTITDTVTESVSSASAYKALVASQQMCFAATTDFVSKSGNPLNGSLAFPATLPNGETGFVGLLSNCSAVNVATTPCVSSRTGTYKSRIANIEIIVSVPAAFAGDPLRSH